MPQDRNQDQSRNQGGSTSNRGFASMDEDKQRAIAAEGGRASHQQGSAHEFDSEEAREAGRKGGQSRGSNVRSESDRDMQASGDTSDDRRGQQAQGRERDEQGQFTSNDDRNDTNDRR